MKTLKLVLYGLVAISTMGSLAFTFYNKENLVSKRKALRPIPKGCVFMTVMGEEKSDSFHIYKSTEAVMKSLDKGLGWLVKAQQKNGGWGAGSHSRQDVMDPHAVNTDPAATSMVAMAMLRSGSTFTSGQYPNELRHAL